MLAIVSMRDISERKLAEQALRESEERLSRVVSAARDAIIMIDAKGNVSLWNDSAVQIFGYSADQVLGKNLHRLIAPARFRDRCQKGLSLFSDSGDGPAVGHVTELTALREDGTEFPVEISLSPVRVNTEWHAVGIVRDITGRKQIEEALKKSEATLRSVFSAAPVVIAITNSNRVPEWMNEGMTSITGYTTEELACRGARLFYASEEKFTHVGKAILDGIQESGIGMTDTKWIQKNGEIRDIHLRGAAIDPNDIPAGLVFMAVDITERKRTEEALEESEAKYRSVVETSLAGVYILQDNLIRFVNRRWCDIFGYRYEEVVDKSGPLDIVHPEDKEMVREKIGQRLTGKFNSSGYEFRALRKDGQVITVRALGRFMVYRGRPAVTGALTDITREKVLESQLLQSQKMEAVGTLAGGIAHDFNNILTVIMGYAAMLQIKMDSADPSRILVGQILSASQKAAGLTHGLLAFSRQQPVSLKPVHINDIVKGTEGLLRRLLSEDIVLTTSLCKEDITIMADPTQIDQILFNLATNARDAMPGGGDLSIETKLLEIDDGFVGMHGPVEPGRYVLLSVSDTGTGMDEKTKDKIFEPFFTTKELGRGTGLGLSTVYGIVKQHDGHVTVYSEQNTGTTFHVYLPAISVAAPEEKSVAQEIRGGTESILLAEDNDDVRRLMKNILAGYGYSVIEAVDGEDAVRKFSSSKNRPRDTGFRDAPDEREGGL